MSAGARGAGPGDATGLRAEGTATETTGTAPPWAALTAARQASVPRVPFFVSGIEVGSVAQAHLDALSALSALSAQREYGTAVHIDAIGVHALHADPTEALAPLNQALREAGLVRAWRNELFDLPDPTTLAPLARIERAAARFWGTLTLGAHATGFVRGPDGRPSHLWIAQRSFDKATDPGLFDNLIGGGVSAGQTPRAALLREAFEEAGLAPDEAAQAQPGRVIRLHRDIPEGFQNEWLFGFDLELPPSRIPVNQDGEVAGFRCLGVDEAIALAAGSAMTTDAALMTLDFLLRQGLLGSAQSVMAELLRPLVVTPPPLD